jgi:hypothetical protein
LRWRCLCWQWLNKPSCRRPLLTITHKRKGSRVKANTKANTKANIKANIKANTKANIKANIKAKTTASAECRCSAVSTAMAMVR